jgi:hypothetical protein
MRGKNRLPLCEGEVDNFICQVPNPITDEKSMHHGPPFTESGNDVQRVWGVTGIHPDPNSLLRCFWWDCYDRVLIHVLVGCDPRMMSWLRY